MNVKRQHEAFLHAAGSALQKGQEVTPKKRRWPTWMWFSLHELATDPRLKLCSREARSYWIDCLLIMHDAKPYGFLIIEGVFLSERQLAITTGDAQNDVGRWLIELKRSGVYSVTAEQMPDEVKGLIPETVPDGVIFSHRMLSDNYKRTIPRTEKTGNS